MVSELRHVTVNGDKLGYEIHAEGSGRPAALFVHGYSGRGTRMKPYASFLAGLAKEFTVYVLDLRGHGASATAGADFSIDKMGDDIAAAATVLGLHDALYVGHSLGGFLGLLCAVRHPGAFPAMCLIASGAARGGSISDLFIRHGRNRDYLLDVLRPHYSDPMHAQAHVEAALLMEPHVHEIFHEQFPTFDLLKELAEIRVPTLMLNGGRDATVSIERQHETALAIPSCKEITFSSLGHNLPCDAPDLMVREIIAFWKNDASRTTHRPE